MQPRMSGGSGFASDRWKIKRSDSVSSLTQQLRELEKDGNIHRKVSAAVPPKVEYSLTEVGEGLRSIVMRMRDWGRQHFGI